MFGIVGFLFGSHTLKPLTVLLSNGFATMVTRHPTVARHNLAPVAAHLNHASIASSTQFGIDMFPAKVTSLLIHWCW